MTEDKQFVPGQENSNESAPAGAPQNDEQKTALIQEITSDNFTALKEAADQEYAGLFTDEELSQIAHEAAARVTSMTTEELLGYS